MQLHAIVHGSVQGVWFRVSTRDVALQKGLSGWVRNTRARTVEVVAQGSKINLDYLVEWLHHGPRYANVIEVDYKFLNQTEELHGFQIRH